MDDLLERALTARLQEVADTVPDELETPADLELQVARQRKRKRTSSGAAFLLAVAAVVSAAVGVAAVVRSTSPAPRPTTGVPLRDPLPPGTRLLAASGRYVVALDRNGKQLATMVAAKRGSIIDVQITRDHRSLWYLSTTGVPGSSCGEVVDADLVDRTSQIIAHAVSFGISPDARRIALSGYGNVANGGCQAGLKPKLAVIDVWNQTRTNIAATRVARSLHWSADGKSLLVETCNKGGDCVLRSRALVGDVETHLRPSAVRERFVAVGADGVYVIPGGSYQFQRYDTALRHGVFDGEVIDGTRTIVPATSGVYEVSEPYLWRVQNEGVAKLRTLSAGPVVAVPRWRVTP
jgi:hypothetical protein